VITVDRGGGPIAPALWFLVAQAGHVGCGGWALGDDARLRCACGTALYELRRVDAHRDRPPEPCTACAAATTDGPDPFRTAFPDVVTAMLALRVPCPWCGAAPDEPCTLPGGVRPLRRTVAHPARLDALGPVPAQPPRRQQHVR
jgi:hypothetical protein